ncbi:hypothetical protein ACFL4K_02245, partial [Candidatus Neomarinimicrobiota bacterium]
EFIKDLEGKVAPLDISEEEINPQAQDDLSLQAYFLEPTTHCYPVSYSNQEDSGTSEFSFFEDGRQRTLQIGFIPAQIGEHHILIPVHYFIVAAVILFREEGRLKLWEEPEVKEGILVRRSLVTDQPIISQFEDQGLLIVDSGGEGGEGVDYYDLRRRALRRAKALRLEVENELIGRWGASNHAGDCFLVVDGTLMNLRNEESVERCIGVSKSFGSRYFSISDHNRILKMEEFERSWVFRFHSPEDESDDLRLGARERLSWYLRLRTKTNADPEFGLIRVEISHRHADLVSEFADRFSKSLISERLPTSYPAPRWDKHLYPICVCENYLSSSIPSIGTIKASMKG